LPQIVTSPASTRLVEAVSPGDNLADTEWTDHVHAIARVTPDVLTHSAATGLWRASSETALLVSDIVLPATVCAKQPLEHREPLALRARRQLRRGCQPNPLQSQHLFACLRSFVANILRFNNAHDVTDARYRIASGGVDAILALRVMNSALNSPGSSAG
jgi:hypothetical protein